jgi:Cd2+/Zn2+-exporting ATPase
LVIGDVPRPSARGALEQLRSWGLASIEMLTGDSEAAAATTAAQVGIERWQAGLMPAEKLQLVRDSQAAGHRPLMIGDGTNDAAALAAAHVSIAMGQGSDIALDAADIALISEDLSRIPWTLGHARRTATILKQNLTVALGTKAVFFALAAMGHSTLWMAVLADMGTSLVVIANALRMLGGRSDDRSDSESK